MLPPLQNQYSLQQVAYHLHHAHSISQVFSLPSPNITHYRPIHSVNYALNIWIFNISSLFLLLPLLHYFTSHIISSENIACATRFDYYISSTHFNISSNLTSPSQWCYFLLLSTLPTHSTAVINLVINSPSRRTCLLVLPYIFSLIPNALLSLLVSHALAHLPITVSIPSNDHINTKSQLSFVQMPNGFLIFCSSSMSLVPYFTFAPKSFTSLQQRSISHEDNSYSFPASSSSNLYFLSLLLIHLRIAS